MRPYAAFAVALALAAPAAARADVPQPIGLTCASDLEGVVP